MMANRGAVPGVRVKMQREMSQRTIVERVARAIAKAHGLDPDERVPTSVFLTARSIRATWRAYEADARAAIKAITEPTPAMIRAMEMTNDGYHEGSSADQWRAAIDVILADS